MGFWETVGKEKPHPFLSFQWFLAPRMLLQQGVVESWFSLLLIPYSEITHLLKCNCQPHISAPSAFAAVHRWTKLGTLSYWRYSSLSQRSDADFGCQLACCKQVSFGLLSVRRFPAFFELWWVILLFKRGLSWNTKACSRVPKHKRLWTTSWRKYRVSVSFVQGEWWCCWPWVQWWSIWKYVR